MGPKEVGNFSVRTFYFGCGPFHCGLGIFPFVDQTRGESGGLGTIGLGTRGIGAKGVLRKRFKLKGKGQKSAHLRLSIKTVNFINLC